MGSNMTIIIVFLQVLCSVSKLYEAITAESSKAMVGNFLLSILWGMFATINVILYCIK